MTNWGETSAATVDQPSSKQAGIAVEMLGTSNWVNTECLETEWGQMIHNNNIMVTFLGGDTDNKQVISNPGDI